MQFSVPQFTDVEDKIIGPLTIKQFGIIFGAGVLIFVIYTISGKNLPVTIFFLLVLGLPAVVLAFGKINGRPMYNALGFLITFILSPKLLFFHRESAFLDGKTKFKDAETISKNSDLSEESTVASPQEKLIAVSSLLEKQEEEERALIGKIK